jgi:DNA invertase Pin-like site-specific DNA recombinase
MQGIEGLGIQSQINAVTNYVNGNGNIIATYSEVETSTRKKRIEIYKAIEYAKANAILVVAKLDRPARDVSFTMLYIMVILILCCDNPSANKLTIQIYRLLLKMKLK